MNTCVSQSLHVATHVSSSEPSAGEVLQLTHTGAPSSVRSPYLGALWDPVPILACYGRNAREQPTCGAKSAVHYGWKDLLLPIMKDNTWPPDTLFVVAEEDWRLRQQDEFHEHTTSSVDTHIPQEKLKDSIQPSELQKMVIGATPRSLCDIVAMVTQAHRQHHGDLVWLSYMRNQSKKGHDGGPNYGSALLALTQRTANVLSEWLEEDGPKAEKHFDCWLRARLIQDGLSQNRRLWASYPFPCVGSFVEHPSGCQPNIGTRAAEWYNEWSQEGTRLEDSVVKEGRVRQLLPFPRSRALQQDRLCWITPATTAHDWWKTLAPQSLFPYLQPVAFDYGLPKPTDLNRRTGGTEFETLCYICPTGPKVTDSPQSVDEPKKSKKRALDQVHPFDDPNENLQDASQAITQRRRRNWRKTRATFYKYRLWTKSTVPPQQINKSYRTESLPPHNFLFSHVGVY